MITMLGKAPDLAARAGARPKRKRPSAANTDFVNGEDRGFIRATKWHGIPTLRKNKLQSTANGGRTTEFFMDIRVSLMSRPDSGFGSSEGNWRLRICAQFPSGLPFPLNDIHFCSDLVSTCLPSPRGKGIST